MVRRCVVVEVPVFQLGGSVDSRQIKDFNFYPEIGCVSFVCVLSCVVSGGGPDILQTSDSGGPVLVYLYSVLVHILWLPMFHGYLSCKSAGVVLDLCEGRINNR